MSLDTVVEDIRKTARQEAEEIREDGQRRAEEIREQANADAEEIRKEAETNVEQRIQQEREQATSAAKLEAKQERLAARRDVLDEVRERTEQAVADLSGERRRTLTASLIAEAATEFGDEPVSVSTRPEDHELVETILEEEGYDNWTVTDERDCLGGIVAESEASRVRVNNTFDSVLADAWESNLKTVSDLLFEDE